MGKSTEERSMNLECITVRDKSFLQELDAWGFEPLRVLIGSLVDMISDDDSFRDRGALACLIEDYLAKFRETVERLDKEAMEVIPGYADGKYVGDHSTPGPGRTEG